MALSVSGRVAFYSRCTVGALRALCAVWDKGVIVTPGR